MRADYVDGAQRKARNWDGEKEAMKSSQSAMARTGLAFLFDLLETAQEFWGSGIKGIKDRAVRSKASGVKGAVFAWLGCESNLVAAFAMPLGIKKTLRFPRDPLSRH
jgi:hypothetical protein